MFKVLLSLNPLFFCEVQNAPVFIGICFIGRFLFLDIVSLQCERNRFVDIVI